MRLILIVLKVSIILATFSCKQRDPNQQIDEGVVDGEVYSSNEIGWTIQIPKGWTVTSKDKLDAYDEKGMKAIEEVYKDGFDYSGLKHLISFQKDKFNIFQSTSEPFKLENKGEWEENNAALKELLYATYQNQGIKIDTASAKTTIDGLGFEVFRITIYSPKGEVILHQDMFSRYINGFDFGVNINYNNDKDRKVMMQAWENSKFNR